MTRPTSALAGNAATSQTPVAVMDIAVLAVRKAGAWKKGNGVTSSTNLLAATSLKKDQRDVPHVGGAVVTDTHAVVAEMIC